MLNGVARGKPITIAWQTPVGQAFSGQQTSLGPGVFSYDRLFTISNGAVISLANGQYRFTVAYQGRTLLDARVTRRCLG